MRQLNPRHAISTNKVSRRYEDAMSESLGEVPEIDVSRPHPARVYDYRLGGCFL
jgi:hypothetical protein